MPSRSVEADGRGRRPITANTTAQQRSQRPQTPARRTAATRVAFVFAGAPRSFVHGRVHHSIQINLLRRLCPPPACVADVFAHVLTGADPKSGTQAGRSITGARVARAVDAEAAALLDGALRAGITPPPPGKLVVERYAHAPGGAAERAEMARDFPGPEHFVFRHEATAGHENPRPVMILQRTFLGWDALLFTATAWSFIPAHCFALP